MCSCVPPNWRPTPLQGVKINRYDHGGKKQAASPSPIRLRHTRETHHGGNPRSSSAPQYARSPEDRRLSHSPVQNPRFWQGSTAHRTWNYVQSGAPHRGEDAPAENTRSGDEELDRERAHNVRREQPEEHDRRGRHHGSRHNRDRDRDDPHRSRSHRHHEHGRDRDRDRDRPRRQKKSWLAAFFCFA
ncbi:hypothetical protein F4825DRAFT_457998 [Nemania diffusa]|nr:hypothetical protein F4825DRAFT_457998 [Nemania diffusa]